MMYNQALTEERLRRVRDRYWDRLRLPNGSRMPDVGPLSVEAAFKRAVAATPWVVPLATGSHRGHTTYQASDPIDRLLLYAANENIRVVTGVRQADRSASVANLRDMMTECTPYRVLKLDIQAFFESVSRASVAERLRTDLALTRTTVRTVESLWAGCDSTGVLGLPRGVVTSAALSELYLRPLDEHLRNDARLFFATRYVDDLALVASGDADAGKIRADVGKVLSMIGSLSAEAGLHPGLMLNAKKSQEAKFSPKGGAAPSAVDFLGYQLTVTPTGTKNKVPKVTVDIAPKKVNKICTRMCAAVAAFVRGGSLDALCDRLRLLTGNFYVPRRGGDSENAPDDPIQEAVDPPQRAGIYYSYPLITESVIDTGAVAELDRFLLLLLTGRRTALSVKLRQLLSRAQRTELLKFSFREGHRTRRLEEFSPQRIGMLSRCWKHV
jgi:hypothetical protein